MNEEIYVSIIIPTYNRRDLLKRAIDSIVNQTYDKWELIVVDDCSTDDTVKMVEGYNDGRIRCVVNESNQGAAGSRNHGVAEAKYDYIAFQDSDDEWHGDKLERQIEYYKNNQNYDLIYSSYEVLRGDNTSLVVPNNQVGERVGNLFGTLLINNVIGAPTVFMKKSVFNEVGGFDSSLRALEDWEFVLRVSEKHQIGFIEDVLVNVYETGGSVSSSGANYYEARCKMLARYSGILQEVGLFDEVVGAMFQDASNRGLLEPVQKMFMMFLEAYNS